MNNSYRSARNRPNVPVSPCHGVSEVHTGCLDSGCLPSEKAIGDDIPLLTVFRQQNSEGSLTQEELIEFCQALRQAQK